MGSTSDRTFGSGTLDDIKAYVDENPESVVTASNRGSGQSTLHSVLLNDSETLEKVSFLIKKKPMSATVKDQWGQCPLHYAAATDTVGPDVLRLLLKSAQ